MSSYIQNQSEPITRAGWFDCWRSNTIQMGANRRHKDQKPQSLNGTAGGSDMGKTNKKINIENPQKYSPASRHSCTNYFADSSCKHMVWLVTVECSGGVVVLWYQLIRTSFSVRWKPCRLIWRELKSPRRGRRSSASRFETLCRKGNRFNCCHPSLPSLSSGYQPLKVFVVIFWPRWIYFRVPLLSYSSNFTLENSKCLWDVFLWTWCN